MKHVQYYLVLQHVTKMYCVAVAYPGIFFRGSSTNSVKDRGQRERRSGSASPLVRGPTQFANGWNTYSYYVVMDVFSTELGIRLSFVKTSEFRGGSEPPNPLTLSVHHCCVAPCDYNAVWSCCITEQDWSGSDCCKHGNEPLGSTKCGESLHKLRNY
jgi:hypothetical protein